MEALLLAAGLGTRLRPLTNSIPKALIEINGTTLLEINIKKLIHQGATHIIVNVHHFADKVIEFITSHSWEVPISVSDESDCLLDTGGAISKAAPLFRTQGPYMIHNVDILSSISLSEMISFFEKSHAAVTLAVSQRQSNRQLLFDAQSRLVGWHNRSTDEYRWSNIPCPITNEMAFSGITVMGQQMLQVLSLRSGVFPIIPVYLEKVNNHVINAYEHDSKDWMDVGKPETLALADSFLRTHNQY